MPAFARTIGIDYSGAETPTVLRAVKLTTCIASCRLSHSAASPCLNRSMALIGSDFSHFTSLGSITQS